MNKIVGFIFLCILCTAVVVILRTLTFSIKSADVVICSEKDEDFFPASAAAIVRFQKALQFKTISADIGVYDEEELIKYLSFIKSGYPTIFSSSHVKHEVVANYSLLLTIKGANSSLSPYLVMGHLDVVPVNEKMWDFPPFDAEINDGFIYARGTIDAKQIVMGTLEALEYILSTGFKPQRSLYVAFGHDEEVTGLDGALSISNLLWSRGVRNLEFIIDEGLTVVNGIVPGLDKPAALIGSSEKGYLTLKLSVKGDTGHSSMPTGINSINILATAITKLTRDCHPSKFGYGPEIETFEHLAPQMKLSHRVVMSNLWLFSPIVSWVLSRKGSTNAIIRTVTSVTMVNGGVKSNVLPAEASAIVNHRIHPAQTVAEVLEYDRSLIADDRVKISIESAAEPHPMSPTGNTAFGYQTIKNSIRQVWPQAVPAPATLVGNTDTKHYLNFTKAVYRFSPTYMFPDDVARFHGNNERISIKNYEQAINFYIHLIKNSDRATLRSIHDHTDEL